MHGNPLVSTIIPVYNGADYLREAVDSVLAQDYDNIEIIIVNDGSNDKGATEEVALSYGDKVRYVSKANGGVATAVNMGISCMRGDYFAWLAHDDWWEPGKISELLSLSAGADEKCLYMSPYVNYLQQEKRKLEAEQVFSTSTLFDVLSNMFTPRMSMASMLIPRKAFAECGVFDPECRTTQDYDLIFKLVKAGYKFVTTNRVLTVRRLHTQMGTLALRDIHIRDLEFLFLKYIEIFFDEIISFSYEQVAVLRQAMTDRGLPEAARRLTGILQWKKLSAGQVTKPFLWLYWENKPHALPPQMIIDSWFSIENKCRDDFEIINLDNHTINLFLENIHPAVWNFSQIAHRADFFRFMLLYQYGGLWLDSDNMLFKKIGKIIDKIDEYGFVCTGYGHKENFFPIICFLGAKPHNLICQKMVDGFISYFEQTVVGDSQPAWDELGGNQLAMHLSAAAETQYFIYPIEFLYPLPMWYAPEELFMPPTNKSRQALANASGLALSFSVTSTVYDFYKYGRRLSKVNLGIVCKLANVYSGPVTTPSRYQRLVAYYNKHGLINTCKKVAGKFHRKLTV